MSDTPETDAFFFRIDIDWDMEVEFARKLERERDEARNQIIGLENKWKCAVDMAAQAENQCDLLKEDIINLEDQRDMEMKVIKRFKEELENSQNQCNELAKAMSYSPESKTLLKKFMQALKDVNEWKNKAYEALTDYTLMEAKCFRLENKLKELNEHT